MRYRIKEIFYTLQGEGANAGRAAVFCRFAGCNLWSGHERDRLSAICQFCDTDFVGVDGSGGGEFANAEEVADTVASHWPWTQATGQPLVVCTGGEPLLQLDVPLITALHRKGFALAIETNGTCSCPPGIDWICMSPKAGTKLKLSTGNELKLVFPQNGADPASFERLDFQFFFLQPMDGPKREAHTAMAVQYCLAHPRWRFSLQTHKYLGIR
jgi:7-carboxy-7-deazaguanine synthase